MIVIIFRSVRSVQFFLSPLLTDYIKKIIVVTPTIDIYGTSTTKIVTCAMRLVALSKIVLQVEILENVPSLKNIY